jgi:hypothetical protein
MLHLARAARNVNTLPVVAVVSIALVALITAFLAGQFIQLYVQALLSNAPIGMLELIGMRLRRTDARAVVHARIRALKAGLDIPVSALEVHAFAGGRLAEVVHAVIAAKEAGIDLPWDIATAHDLAGRNLLEEVQQAQRQCRRSLVPLGALPGPQGDAAAPRIGDEGVAISEARPVIEVQFGSVRREAHPEGEISPGSRVRITAAGPGRLRVRAID